MGRFVDFAELKRRVSIEQVARMLRLQTKQEGDRLRAPCPACQKGDDRAIVITPAKEVFYCHAIGMGGDCIRLAAHIREEPLPDAAAWIQAQLGEPTVTGSSTVTGNSTPTVNSNATAEPRLTKEDAALAKIAARLDPEHPVLAKLGLSTATAEKLGIGVDNRGVMRGRLCLPLYEDGQLVGFLGLSLDPMPDVKLPKNLVEPPSAQVIPITSKTG